MSDCITISNLNKRIQGRQVLNNISLTLKKGTIIGLLGPNGSGKTTLIKTIVNLYHPDSGSIMIGDEKAGYRANRTISYMPDFNHLYPWMRVKDAINYYHDMFVDFDCQKAKELCDYFGFNEGERISTLSKGTQEKVRIMLTLSRNVMLYILDEPIDSIDLVSRKEIIHTLFSESKEQSTVMISTHQVQDTEALFEEVVFLNQGRVIFTGNAENIREESGKSVEEYYLEVFQYAKIN